MVDDYTQLPFRVHILQVLLDLLSLNIQPLRDRVNRNIPVKLRNNDNIMLHHDLLQRSHALRSLNILVTQQALGKLLHIRLSSKLIQMEFFQNIKISQLLNPLILHKL